MNRYYSSLFLLFCLIVTTRLVGQTTLNTTVGSTGYTSNNGLTANGCSTFNIENTSGGPIYLTDVASHFLVAANGATVTLWYTATSLGGSPTVQAPVWTSIISGTLSVPVDGVTSCFTGLNFMIPDNTEYRFALQSTHHIRYSGTGTTVTCIPNSFTANGVTLKAGNAVVGGGNVGYGGAIPTPPNTPRFFTGYITFTNSPLSVNMASFTARKKNDNITLNWATSAEDNMERFIVERSVNGISFKEIGSVVAAGTPGSYSFNDMHLPLDQKLYYRLQIKNKGGASEYSKTLQVLNNNDAAGIKVFPGHFTNQLTVSVNLEKEGRVHTSITSLSGRKIVAEYSELLPAGNGSINIATGHLSAGIYIIEVNADGERFVQKIIKQ